MSAVAPQGDAGVAPAPALTVTSISKTFPGQRALDGVDIDVARGEIHALVGQNGCGKSTLVKVLAGYHDADPGGHVQVAGKATNLGTPAAAHAAGMRFVHQDLGLIAALPVSDNFRLGIRERRSAAPLDRSNERRRVVEGLEVLRLRHQPASDGGSAVRVGAHSGRPRPCPRRLGARLPSDRA